MEALSETRLAWALLVTGLVALGYAAYRVGMWLAPVTIDAEPMSDFQEDDQ